MEMIRLVCCHCGYEGGEADYDSYEYELMRYGGPPLEIDGVRWYDRYEKGDPDEVGEVCEDCVNTAELRFAEDCCERCGRPHSTEYVRWAAPCPTCGHRELIDDGRPDWISDTQGRELLCPGCQTPADQAAARERHELEKRLAAEARQRDHPDA